MIVVVFVVVVVDVKNVSRVFCCSYCCCLLHSLKWANTKAQLEVDKRNT